MDAVDIILFYLPWALLILLFVVYIMDSLKSDQSRKIFQKDQRTIKRLEERDKAFKATTELNAIVLDTLKFKITAQRIANAIPQFLGYQTGVLALIDKEQGILKRVAISETTGGIAALQSLEIPFSSIAIELSAKENYCIRALNENKVMYTTQLYDVLCPVVSRENSEKVQRMMGTKTTLIFPIYSKDKKPLGTFLVSMSKKYDAISEYEHETIKSFIDSVRIALSNASLYTSLEKATIQLKEANAKLKQLDLLKNEFVSVASHELRTPMTAIKSYLWMALQGKGGKLTEKQHYYIERGYNSVDRLIRLVNDMLNISRIESGKITTEMQSVDLMQLAKEVVDEVLPRANEVGVKVIIDEPNKHLSHVLADSDKIKEVLFNLIGNSLKFTPKDGTVTVKFVEDEGLVTTKIIDTGNGIDPDDIGKLFQKFGLLPGSYTTNQPAMGTGLGLYICREILDMHEGKIWAESEGKGKGTTLSFTLKVFSPKDKERLSSTSSGKKEAVDLIHSQL